MKLAKTYTFLLSVCCGACAALDYLSPGFAHVKLNDGTTETFQVEDLHNVPVTVDAFTINNIPDYAHFKSTTFSLHSSRVNDHNVYYNGQYFVFFLQNVEPHGTWLLGDKLGVDSGIAYLRPDVHTLVPVDIESAKVKWNFLRDGKWVAESAVRVEVVVGGSTSRLQYNPVSYFHRDVVTQSVLLMTPIDKELQSRGGVDSEEEEPVFRFSPSLAAPLPTEVDSAAALYPLFWSSHFNKWISCTLLFVIPRATPVRLIDLSGGGVAAGDKGNGGGDDDKGGGGDGEGDSQAASSQVVHLVGDEHTSHGWRLFLRVTDRDAGAELEVKLSLSQSGLESHLRVETLEKSAMQAYIKKQNKKIMTLSEGAYLWLWFRADSETVGESRYLAFTSGNYLLKCVGKVSDDHNERYVFEYHHSHRRVAMDRTVLSLTTSLITAAWNDDTNALEWWLDDAPLLADAVFPLGPDPVTWLRDYLIAHEDFLAPGLSSCFMYHGGLAMPEQLIYAAEIICVLIGSKPMTMVSRSLVQILLIFLIYLITCVYMQYT
jgi:hypothetical protein